MYVDVALHRSDDDFYRDSGVIETGLFINMAKVAYFGTADGKVNKRLFNKLQS